MSWLKSSDTAGQHPIVTAPMAWEPVEGDVVREDLANLLYGLVNRCATHSAQYDTDYVISDGTVATIGGPGWRARAAQAERAGYWSRIEDRGYLLVDDSEHLFHIRLRAEKEWERIRKADNGNPALTVPVRVRDGDGCRYCGCIVNWAARRGSRKGTYDHRQPGQAARGPDDLFVCCGLCNSTRGDNPDALLRLPAPTSPFYGQDTVDFLAGHGITVPLSTPARPRTRRDTAPTTGHPATSGTAPTARPAGQADPAPPPRDPAAGGTPRPTRPGSRPDTAPAPDEPAPGGTTSPPARPAAQADTAPATPPPAGHRALRTTHATPQPVGHRALRDRAPGPTPRASTTTQDQQGLLADSGRNRQIGGLPDLTVPGRDRDRDGHGSGAPASSPAPANRNRRRRGRRGGPQPPPRGAPPPGHLEDP